MRKSILAPLVITAVVLSGCGRAPEAVVADLPGTVARTVKEVAVRTDAPVTFADLSIEGMSCEMMCGGSIKKALAKLPGVSATEIKFVEGETVDHAIVTYDEGQVSDTELVKAVQALHDGQYKVLAIAITKQVPGGESAPGTGSNVKEEKGVSARMPTEVVLPGIVALLTRILRY